MSNFVSLDHLQKESIVRSLFILAVSVWVLTACAMQQKEVAASLENPGPVNCATASSDIQTLENEKTNVAQQVASGVTAIVPVGLVMGILTGTEGTKIKVATGEYNEAIDKRIKQIKMECDIR